MADNRQRLHATIYGRVQGVSFRYYTTLRAKELGVSGWVHNLDDGSVEVAAEGNLSQLEVFVAFLRTGPMGAHVKNVTIEWHEANGEFSDFNVR